MTIFAASYCRKMNQNNEHQEVLSKSAAVPENFQHHSDIICMIINPKFINEAFSKKMWNLNYEIISELFKIFRKWTLWAGNAEVTSSRNGRFRVCAEGREFQQLDKVWYISEHWATTWPVVSMLVASIWIKYFIYSHY